MKLSSTLKLTVILLTLMGVAGLISGLYGFKMGSLALEGVSQPEVNPTKKASGSQGSSSNPQSFTAVSEQSILVKVDAIINGKKSEAKPAEPKKEPEEKPESFLKSESDTSDNSPVSFPLKSSDGGVTLEVTKVSQQAGSLLLEVNLKNDSSDEIQFLYSFLDLKDSEGNSLSPITEGLPGKLPANSKPFPGVVKIPTTLIDKEEKLSLNLTDYPEQKLQLKIANIPVN